MAFKRSGVRLPLAPPISNFSLWRGGKTYGEAQHWRQLSVLIELAANARGLAAQQRKQLDEALAFYDRALTLNPELVEVLYNRGNALNELKRFDEALESFDHALAIRPDHVSTLNNRGRALEHLMCLKEALASYDRALTVNPQHANAIKNRTSVLQKLQRVTA